MGGSRPRETDVPMGYSLRRARVSDIDFLWVMLYEAAYAAEDGVPDAASLRRHAVLVRYVEGWGRRNDLGVVASDDETGELVGAAWVRLLTGDASGYGYIDDETPELAIAVLPPHRGRGLGERMLRELLDRALADFDAVSLSVRADNPALRLYERTGFLPVGETDAGDAPAGTSITMKRDLRGGPTGRSRRRC
jgi:ribosomal protein S18 acetylase RimI-like enzyme